MLNIYWLYFRLETSTRAIFFIFLLQSQSRSNVSRNKSYSTNIHEYTNHTMQKCLISIFLMLTFNEESKLQMKINLPFYIFHQQNYYALQTWLVKSWTWYGNQTFGQSAYWRLIINSFRISCTVCKLWVFIPVLSYITLIVLS